MNRHRWSGGYPVEKPKIEQHTELSEKVMQALGEASMCWNPRPGNQVFDATNAERIGNELIKYIEEHR